MSPIKQNKAIAIACGWDQVWTDEHGTWGKPPEQTPATGGFAIVEREIPNYVSDLNAIHEAENILAYQLAHAGYMRKLAEVCYREWPKNRNPECATAKQRTEAVLLALGLWVEEPVANEAMKG